jgi:hypothetical protein
MTTAIVSLQEIFHIQSVANRANSAKSSDYQENRANSAKSSDYQENGCLPTYTSKGTKQSATFAINRGNVNTPTQVPQVFQS